MKPSTTRPPPWLGPSLLVAGALGPLIPWAQTRPSFDASVALRTTAVPLALVGLAAFALNLVLGARLRPVEWMFGGLDRLYRVHKRVGVVAMLLLVGHGFLIAASVTAPSLPEALRIATVGQGWRVTLGVLAAAMLAGAVLVSLYVPLAHPTFVWMQRSMGLVFGLGAAHALLVPGAKAASRPLTVYLMVLAAAGGAAFLYRTVLGRVAVPRHPYRVEAVNRLGPDIAEFVFAPQRKAMSFRSGQFAFVTFLSNAHPEPHPFSIASAPADDRLRMVVKALGVFTRQIQTLPSGIDALVEGPYGGFTPLQFPNPRQVWIAGGIGITPFLSAARSLDGQRDVDLYYCTERAEEAHFIDELFAIADRLPRLRVIPIRKTDLGYITATDIDGASHVLAQSEVFICGPPVMMRTLSRQLEALGMPRRRIHFEDFSFV